MKQESNPPRKLSDSARNALLEALEDERAAESLYAAVIERHGPVRPFVNIIESERRHQKRLLSLFEQFDVPVPPKAAGRSIELADSLEEECRRAVSAERENVRMYDRFLADIEEPDILDAFRDLRRASSENHLQAFERCVGRYQER